MIDGAFHQAVRGVRHLIRVFEMEIVRLLKSYAAGQRDFGHVDFREAWMPGIALPEVGLAQADLTGANLSHSLLQRADFTGAMLWRANFTYGNLDGACLEKGNS
jgi:uncharacterized protein YjbI with pentapeptide repeats